MLLKRIYEEQGSFGPTCVGVEVVHSGLNPEQNFSMAMVERGLSEGWIVQNGDVLELRTPNDVLRYQVKRRPGYYCSSTGERIPVSAVAWNSRERGILCQREARKWLQERGKGPNDYEVTNAYECALNPEQHMKYRAVVGPSGQAKAAYLMGE